MTYAVVVRQKSTALILQPWLPNELQHACCDGQYPNCPSRAPLLWCPGHRGYLHSVLVKSVKNYKPCSPSDEPGSCKDNEFTFQKSLLKVLMHCSAACSHLHGISVESCPACPINFILWLSLLGHNNAVLEAIKSIGLVRPLPPQVQRPAYLVAAIVKRPAASRWTQGTCE